MRQRHVSRAKLIELTAFGGIVVFALIGVAFSMLSNDSGSGDDAAMQAVAATGEPTVSGDATAAQTPGSTTTPAPGEVILLPASPYGQLTLVYADTPPAISEAAAIELARGWSSEPLGDDITATFGLATFGQPGVDGAPWIGNRNIPLPTGELLDHIDSRPMWIVDVGSVEGFYAGEPGLSLPPYNHVVYAVDDMTQAVVLVWSYPGE